MLEDPEAPRSYKLEEVEAGQLLKRLAHVGIRAFRSSGYRTNPVNYCRNDLCALQHDLLGLALESIMTKT